MKELNILIVDDHILFCTGIEQLLKNLLSAEVTVCFNPIDALDLNLSSFDIALVDLDMPEMKGFEFIQRAREQSMNTKYVIVSMHSKPSIVRKVIKQKIDGYILKDDEMNTFKEGIKSILNGNQYFTPRLQNIINVAQPHSSKISPREEEIIKLIADGLSMKEISEVLHISHETVKTHTKNVRSKLNLDSRTDLIKYAIENLLV
ncbi:MULTISPECIES: response regulator transcription factor [Flammeovirga]|uniref:Response regulator transcription factor n=1 Tax=Flammeovirga agarivorans TaxID=2726742 RepID=A0A7X8XXV4_9BACT|nr:MULTISPECIES: response regulator transcription factor [Flammeovirga]NLR93602.1 response regulator transcription factor [Flammeovirga agarivorans]